VPAPPGLPAASPRVHPRLEPDAAAYAAQKAAADSATGERGPQTSSAPAAPTALRNWVGQRDTTVAPSDSTGAIGPARYVELVNERFAIYSRTSNVPLSQGTLHAMMGCVAAGCPDSLFDVQVIWDPGTNRFYYAADDVLDSSHNFLALGFSTTATPTTAADWCRYNLGFGANFPDYPKLGDTKDFWLVGENVFSGSSFAGSFVSWLTKPGAGSVCPAASTFKAGTSGPMKNSDGSAAFTPVPANQTDTSSTGWIVARPVSIPAGGATFLTVFNVTRSGTGTALIQTTGASVSVAAYKVPASAPQQGTTFKLDTLDTRNTQAVSAIDPTHASAVGLWTQHTILGGAGAQVRWYEINPATHTVIQTGQLSSPSLFIFNGAVSPDRRVNGASALFGGDMVMDVNTSSAATLPAVKVASKIGANPISALVNLATSTSPDTGFDCIRNHGLCRWGDYAAATPDPASPTTAATGQVWGTSMLGAPGGSSSSSGWTTQNFGIKP
jgi:hypothetical protein